MINKIVLRRDELEDIYNHFQKIYEDQDHGLVTLEYDNSSGIGGILTATFHAKIGDIFGDFTVTISDETDW